MKYRYSPDEFMKGLYANRAKPFDNIGDKTAALAAGEKIRAELAEIFALNKIPDKVSPLSVQTVSPECDCGSYYRKKIAVKICRNLEMTAFVLRPKKLSGKTAGVVALCGHGYGARQIVGVSKRGRKRIVPILDNYQKLFAVEIAKRGAVVVVPELFGFGEARLEKDMSKPFYASSCHTLSSHLLPYGLTTASLRIFQTLCCADLLVLDENVDPARLGVAGISGGGLTALYSACLDPRFSTVAISGYVNTFKDSILSVWHCPDNYFPDVMNVGEIYDFAAALAPRRLLVECGKRDRIFPIEGSKTAIENIEKIYSLCGARERFTADIHDGAHRISGRYLFDFFTEG